VCQCLSTTTALSPYFPLLVPYGGDLVSSISPMGGSRPLSSNLSSLCSSNTSSRLKPNTFNWVLGPYLISFIFYLKSFYIIIIIIHSLSPFNLHKYPNLSILIYSPYFTLKRRFGLFSSPYSLTITSLFCFLNPQPRDSRPYLIHLKPQSRHSL
jgi:hypothetical protein